MSGLRMGPSWRVVSPSGGSTLITSAPRSPSCCAAHGPSTTVVQSTTRTPFRGPDMTAILVQVGVFFLFGERHERDAGDRSLLEPRGNWPGHPRRAERAGQGRQGVDR